MAGIAPLAVGEDGVAEVRLDRPERGNAFDLELSRELNQRLRECESREDVRAILLSSSGDAFCVGGDLGYMAEALPRAGSALRELADEMHIAARSLARSPKPVVAAVGGATAGVGVSLVCATDFAVASPKASFVVAYTAVGLSPDGGCSWLLPRMVGRRVATDLILTNRRLTATAAASIGLVNDVVDDEDLLGEARRLAVAASSAPAGAVAASLRLLRASGDRSLDEQLELEADEIARRADSEEAAAAIEQFLASRANR
jgi:2-(1,2-epoxy-1,2-dihydrophenyl)acetyl-CoA isomerase